MGDALFASEESMYNFDLQSIYSSFLHSVEDDQGPISGDVPFVVPGGIPGASSCNDIAWTSAYPILTGQLGTFYGDSKAADQHWDSIIGTWRTSSEPLPTVRRIWLCVTSSWTGSLR